MKLLLVEDDQKLAQLITEALKNQRYLVDTATDGQMGWEWSDVFQYDLILLDLMLPKLNGIQFCQQIRKKGDLTPVLLITGQDEAVYKVKALDAGADDYLVKPFDIQELLARVRALLRRGGVSTPPLLKWGLLSLNPSNCQVTYQDQCLHLTAKEYSILELFLRNHQRIFSQSALIEHLWSFDESPSENAVRTLVKSLRQKLRQAGASSDLIETVYGLGYRFNPKEIEAESILEKTLDDLSPQFYSSLAESVLMIWEKHKDKYLQELDQIEEIIKTSNEKPVNKSLQKKAIQAAHTLAGALGSFGFKVASQYAIELETSLKNNGQFNLTQAEKLLQVLQNLRQEITPSHSDQEKNYPQISPKDSHFLIIDQDLKLAKTLAEQAQLWGLKVRLAGDLSTAKEAIATFKPDVILLDPDLNEGEENGLEFLQELSQLNPAISRIIYTHEKSFSYRVKVARLGISSFLQKPISPSEIIEFLIPLLEKNAVPAPKILIVDDDPQLLELIETLLQPWGFRLTLLEDSREFWQTLGQSNPDLLILDVEMPEFSGIDLCQVVRNDPHWHQLPILFLSAHTETNIIREGLNAGADDYIYKPIEGAQLVARILKSLEREKYRRQLIGIYPVTGIINRPKSIPEFTRLLHLSQRQNQSCCLIVLEIEHLREIHEHYGYEIGDGILQRLGEHLKKTFRTEDIIAHWERPEFVLGLYNIKQADGLNRIDHFLANWHQEQFSSSCQIPVSLRVGIAEYPKEGPDLQTLYHTALRGLSSRRI